MNSSDSCTWNPFTVAELKQILAKEVGQKDDTWLKARRKADLIKVCTVHLTRQQAVAWSRKLRCSRTQPPVQSPPRMLSVLRHRNSPQTADVTPPRHIIRRPAPVMEDSRTASMAAREQWIATKKSRTSIPIARSIFKSSSSSGPSSGSTPTNLKTTSPPQKENRHPVEEAISPEAVHARKEDFDQMERTLTASIRLLDRSEPASPHSKITERPPRFGASPVSRTQPSGSSDVSPISLSPLLRPSAAQSRPSTNSRPSPVQSSAQDRPSLPSRSSAMSRPSMITPVKIPSVKVPPQDSTFALDSFRPTCQTTAPTIRTDMPQRPWWQHTFWFVIFGALFTGMLCMTITGRRSSLDVSPPDPVLETCEGEECSHVCPMMTRRRNSIWGRLVCEDIRPKVRRDARDSLGRMVRYLELIQNRRMCGDSTVGEGWVDVYELLDLTLLKRSQTERDEISLVMQEDFLYDDETLYSLGLARRAFKLRALTGPDGKQSCTRRSRSGLWSLFGVLSAIPISARIISSWRTHRHLKIQTIKHIRESTYVTDEGYGTGPSASELANKLGCDATTMRQLCYQLSLSCPDIVSSKLKGVKEGIYFCREATKNR